MCRNNRGFTLIELLIALLLLVILTGAVYGTYFSVVRARERGGAKSQARRELSSTLGMLRNELASAFYFTGTVPVRTQGKTPPANGTPVTTNPGQNLEFVVEDRDSFGNSASLLQFTSLTPPKVGSSHSSDVQAVRYSVEEKDGVLTLDREAKDLYLQVKSAPYPVIENIEAFQVECYDGSKWVKTWDTALTPRLPSAVRATVTLKGGEKFAVVATTGLMRTPTGIPGSTGSGGIAGSSALGGILNNLPAQQKAVTP